MARWRDLDHVERETELREIRARWDAAVEDHPTPDAEESFADNGLSDMGTLFDEIDRLSRAAAVPVPDAGDDTLRREMAETIERELRAHPTITATPSNPGVIGTFGGMSPHALADALLPRIREHVARRAEKAEATIESLRGEHTRGSGEHSSFCAGCDRVWPCPTIWLIDKERP